MFCCCVPFLALDVSQTTYFHFWEFPQTSQLWWIYDLASTRASLWKSSFSYFSNWVSGLNLTAFYDFRNKLQNSWFPWFFIWRAPEHNFGSRHFMAIFISCALVSNKWHFTSFATQVQKDRFSGISHATHTRASLLKSSFHYYFHKRCSGANHKAFWEW